MKTDSQIQRDVMQELAWNPMVTHEHIGVSVVDGVVTLSGQVPSYIEKHSAENVAKRIAGVKAVVEKIEVRLPGNQEKDDQQIAKAILNHFKWNTQVPETLLKVTVEDGYVELTGEVEWEYQRLAAQKCVRGLAGVKNISNNIVLKKKQIEPNVVKERIEAALKREAERDARKISVEVKGSKVILTGDVKSFTEADDARIAAWCAPGVMTVENHLNIIG